MMKFHCFIHGVLRTLYDIHQSHPSTQSRASRFGNDDYNIIQPVGREQIESTSIPMDGLLLSTSFTNNESLWCACCDDGRYKDKLYFFQKWSTTRKVVRRILVLFLARWWVEYDLVDGFDSVRWYVLWKFRMGYGDGDEGGKWVVDSHGSVFHWYGQSQPSQAKQPSQPNRSLLPIYVLKTKNTQDRFGGISSLSHERYLSFN